MTTTIQIRAEIDVAMRFKAAAEKLALTHGKALARAVELLEAEAREAVESPKKEELV